SAMSSYAFRSLTFLGGDGGDAGRTCVAVAVITGGTGAFLSDSVRTALPPVAVSGRRKPAIDLRSCADSSASLPTEPEVAAEFSAVCELISRSTPMVREMFCAAEACCRELAEMFCTRLAI